MRIEVPRGGAITLNISREAPLGKDGREWVYLSRAVRDEAGNVLGGQDFGDWNLSDRTPEHSKTWSDLPPGEYGLGYQAHSKQDCGEPMMNPGMAEDRTIQVGSGTSETVSIVYKPFDRAALRGEVELKLRVVTPAGDPVPNFAFRIFTRSREHPDIEVTTGTLDLEGRVTIPHLRGGKDSPKYRVTSVNAEGAEFGAFRLEQESGAQEITITRAFERGDKAADFRMTNLATGAEAHLTDFKGKVVYVDFWATWCGPCQIPTGQLIDAASKNASRWGDRVQLVALSGDDKKDDLLAHIEKKKWDSPIHYWSNIDGVGFQSEAFRRYQVSGIPSAFLIDQNGIIRSVGVHRGEDLVKAIDVLLAQGEK